MVPNNILDVIHNFMQSGLQAFGHWQTTKHLHNIVFPNSQNPCKQLFDLLASGGKRICFLQKHKGSIENYLSTCMQITDKKGIRLRRVGKVPFRFLPSLFRLGCVLSISAHFSPNIVCDWEFLLVF